MADDSQSDGIEPTESPQVRVDSASIDTSNPLSEDQKDPDAVLSTDSDNEEREEVKPFRSQSLSYADFRPRKRAGTTTSATSGSKVAGLIPARRITSSGWTLSPRPREDSPFPAATPIQSRSSAEEDKESINSTTSRELRRERTQIEKLENDVHKEPDEENALWAAVVKLIKPTFLRYDWKSIKTVSRTWLCTWTGILFMAIRPVNQWLGQGAFVISMVGLIDICGGISITHCIVTSLITSSFAGLGVLITYICSVIEWRLRGFPSKEEVFQTFVSSGACKAGDSICFANELRKGHYLELRCTVITIFGIAAQLWITGMLEQRAPRLFKIPFVLGMIVMIPTISAINYTPYNSFWDYARSSVICLYFAVALRIILSILIFPTTSNFKYVDGITSILTKAHSFSDAFMAGLSTAKPTSEEFRPTFSALSGDSSALIAGFVKYDLDGLMLKGEFSYSRFDKGDLGELRARIRAVTAGLNILQFFISNIEVRKDAILKKARKRTESFAQEQHHFHNPLSAVFSSGIEVRRYKEAGRFESQLADRQLYHPDDEIDLKKLDEIFSVIVGHYLPALVAGTDLLKIICNWLEEANSFRYKSIISKSHHNKRVAAQGCQSAELLAGIQRLEEVHGQSTQSVAQYRDRVRGLSIHDANAHSFALSQDSFFGFAVKEYISRIHRLARYCTKLDETQPVPRWINPFAKSRVKALSVGFTDLDRGPSEGVELDAFKPLSSVEVRDADSSPPQNVWHVIGSRIVKIYNFLVSPTVVFCLKRAFVVNMPLILMYCSPTLAFGFGVHVVWVSIMMVMTMAPQAVDGIYGLLQRIYYSFWGCTLGVIGWYMSTGHGDGSAPGFAIVGAFLYLIMAMHRHFNSHAIPMGSVVLALSSVLVPGFSWQDTQHPSGKYLGHGLKVGWVRFVMVIIGVSLGFLFGFFPFPTTGKKAARKALGECVRSLGDNHASVINFGMQRLENGKVHRELRSDGITRRFVQLASKLQATSRVADMLKFEPPLSGVWPQRQYRMLIRVTREINMLQNMSYSLLDKVRDSGGLSTVLDEMAVTNVVQLSNLYAVVHMAADSLIYKSPLPSVTPGRLANRYRLKLDRLMGNLLSTQEGLGSLYLDYDGRLRLASVVIARLIYEKIDGVIILVKSLVGETYDTDTRVLDLNEDEDLL